jgi:glycosyltransferase involved in cell wall biosynthesis
MKAPTASPNSRSKYIELSVIVPLKNPPGIRWIRYLEKVLPDNSEIILVGEKMPQKAIASGRITMLRAKCSRSQARNIGLSTSHGELVFFLDADQLPSKALFREILELFRRGYDAIKVPEKFMATTRWGKASALWKQSVQKADKEYGCIPRAYSRNILLKVKGFDARLDVTEDFTLYMKVRKLGIKEAWASSSLYHLEEDNLLEIIRKSILYTEALLSIRKDDTDFKATIAKYAAILKVFVRAMSSKAKPDVKICCILLIVTRLLLLTVKIVEKLLEICRSYFLKGRIKKQ